MRPTKTRSKFLQRRCHQEARAPTSTPLLSINTSNGSLLCEGTSSVYMLNVRKRDLGQSSTRWFDVIPQFSPADDTARVTRSMRFNYEGQHQKSQLEHKVIMLMGATGSGKSTLINGMVNYILEVQWQDPYRFCVIQPESVASAKESDSQTKTVTAYTLRHQDGMAVPYSLTIVDTPGYGDTGGVDKDKVNTRNIHEFLSNRLHPITEIHAVCFVAISGDARLTTPQKYILDSVLSSFGSDLKDNIRLLVTFADSSDPPVVEACRAAHFPVPFRSDDILYNKFNSSVLYANNRLEDQDNDNCNKMYWEMGEKSFKEFFDQLGRMKGCSLASTRQVIERRNALEPMISAIQRDLEYELVKIENAERFVRKYNEYIRKGLNPDSINHMKLEFTSVSFEKISNDYGVKFKYCTVCQISCGEIKVVNKHIFSFGQPKSSTSACTNSLCRCSNSQHVEKLYELRERFSTVSMSLAEMENYYAQELSCKGRNVNKLLEKCSAHANYFKREVLRKLGNVYRDGLLNSSPDALVRSNSPFTVTDCLYMMKSRIVGEDEKNLTRLNTFSSLQKMLSDQEKGGTTL